MFYVRVSDPTLEGTINVSFAHYTGKELSIIDVAPDYRGEDIYRNGTDCFICIIKDCPIGDPEEKIPWSQRESTMMISQGTAYMHENDRCFSKAIGRRKSLAKALASLPKNVRAEIWKAYALKSTDPEFKTIRNYFAQEAVNG